MFANAESHTKRYDACQHYDRNDLHLDLPLNPSFPFVPFEKWGIDYIGPIHPISSRGMQYVVVVIEYLTRWVEAKAVNLQMPNKR
jgi:hypothetical protein